MSRVIEPLVLKRNCTNCRDGYSSRANRLGAHLGGKSELALWVERRWIFCFLAFSFFALEGGCVCPQSTRSTRRILLRGVVWIVITQAGLCMADGGWMHHSSQPLHPLSRRPMMFRASVHPACSACIIVAHPSMELAVSWLAMCSINRCTRSSPEDALTHLGVYTIQSTYVPFHSCWILDTGYWIPQLPDGSCSESILMPAVWADPRCPMVRQNCAGYWFYVLFYSVPGRRD